MRDAIASRLSTEIYPSLLPNLVRKHVHRLEEPFAGFRLAGQLCRTRSVPVMWHRVPFGGFNPIACVVSIKRHKKSARTHCWRTPLSKYVFVLGLLKIKMKIWSSAPAHFAPGPQPLASGRRLCASAQAFGLALELYRVSRRICIRDVRNWPGFQAVCEFSPIGPQPRNPAPLKATVW